MATRDNEMQHLKVRHVEELGRARILGNARNSAGALSSMKPEGDFFAAKRYRQIS
jgi:hypothetical protein